MSNVRSIHIPIYIDMTVDFHIDVHTHKQERTSLSVYVCRYMHIYTQNTVHISYVLICVHLHKILLCTFTQNTVHTYTECINVHTSAYIYRCTQKRHVEYFV